MPFVSAWKSYAMYLQYSYDESKPRTQSKYLLDVRDVKLLHVVPVLISHQSLFAVLLRKIHNCLSKQLANLSASASHTHQRPIY